MKHSQTTSQLWYLWHPGTSQIFSGYGLRTGPSQLKGLLLVDRPGPVSQVWLDQLQRTFGEVQLLIMTKSGDRGLACYMDVLDWHLVRQFELPIGQDQIVRLLQDLTPAVKLTLSWSDELNLWESDYDA